MDLSLDDDPRNWPAYKAEMGRRPGRMRAMVKLVTAHAFASRVPRPADHRSAALAP